MSSPEPRPVEMARVLGTLGHELAALAAMSDEVQESLSELLGAMPLTNADLVAVQNLDLIAQHIAALATYVEALAGQAPTGWEVLPERAATDVKLSALAHRLAFHSPAEIAEDPDDPVLF